MRPTLKLLTALSLALLAGVAWPLMQPYEGRVGYDTGTAGKIPFDIWYPARSGGRLVTVGGNGVFQGTKAGRGAPHDGARHPLIVMSHGAGGNAGQFGWIASRLAEAGFVVVLPNHPGSTSGQASEAAVRIWERPLDIHAVLNEITLHPEAWPGIDPNRIGVLGFSAGGYTALALSGARVDPARLAGFCDQGGRGMSDCAFFAHLGINLHKVDLGPAAQDLRDTRIRFAVAIDPGIVETLTPASLSAIDLPLLVINLGDEARVPAPVHARAVAETVPGALYRIVPDAIHFSFLAECNPKGAAILAEEGEADPLCSNAHKDVAEGRSRAAIHAELAKVILDFLGRIR